MLSLLGKHGSRSGNNNGLKTPFFTSLPSSISSFFSFFFHCFLPSSFSIFFPSLSFPFPLLFFIPWPQSLPCPHSMCGSAHPCTHRPCPNWGQARRGTRAREQGGGRSFEKECGGGGSTKEEEIGGDLLSVLIVRETTLQERKVYMSHSNDYSHALIIESPKP